MKTPLNWLGDYVEINISPEEFADAMTMSGSKVEGIEVTGGSISNIVAGRVVLMEKHPDADKLSVAMVDIGNGVIQVVTGARNVRNGDCIPVALDGAELPGGKKIAKGLIRGVESNGMMCSIQELNLTREDYPEAVEDGIFILDDSVVPGSNIKEVLGLGEPVVEFEITSNRPDCLSMIGIAREAAVTLGSNFRKPDIKLIEQAEDVNAFASVEIADPDLCPRYAARIIRDVTIEPSPLRMKQRLKAAGVRPINNIVDITNYVMLEFGQPMHAFDLDKLKDSKIIVRRAGEGEVLKTLDGQDRQLDTSMLVIADGVGPVAVAGVMGGGNSEISEETRNILFESANFEGTSVRLTSRKLGMRTEASGRFEKGLDIENVTAAVNRAAQLVEELGAGRVCKGIIDCCPVKLDKRSIKFDHEKINSFLGTSISPQKMMDILRSLELEIDESIGLIGIPSFRNDIEGWADLAEEVARFYGYNKIEASLLSGKTSTQGKKTFKQKVEDLIKNTMISCGLSEAYTYSFASPGVFDRINLPADSELRNTVTISNPLGEDYSIMRTTTIPDMLTVLARNYNRRIEQAALFELSFVYLPVVNKNAPAESGQLAEKFGKDPLPVEKPVLTIGMYGKYDFYSLKGIIEELLDTLGIMEYSFEQESGNPTFHPGRTANLYVNGIKTGIAGEVHPYIIERFDGPQRSLLAAIDVEPLIKSTKLMKKYKPLPKFPAVIRDIAMVVKEEVSVGQIEGIIKESSGTLLEEAALFDVYKGKQLAEGTKSVAFSLTFRVPDRTLTDEEVNAVMRGVVEALKDKVKAHLRE